MFDEFHIADLLGREPSKGGLSSILLNEGLDPLQGDPESGKITAGAGIRFSLLFKLLIVTSPIRRDERKIKNEKKKRMKEK